MSNGTPATQSEVIALARLFFDEPMLVEDDRSLLALDSQTGHADEAAELRIVRALKARLDLVSAHHQGTSKPAGQLRLALHAAAARLLTGATPLAKPGRAGTAPALSAQVAALLSGPPATRRRGMARVHAMAQLAGVDPAELLRAVTNQSSQSPVQSAYQPSPQPSHPNPSQNAPSFPRAPRPLPRQTRTHSEPERTANHDSVEMASSDVFPADSPKDDPAKKLAFMVAGGVAAIVVLLAIATIAFFTSRGNNSTVKPTGPTASGQTTTPSAAESPDTAATSAPVRPLPAQPNPPSEPLFSPTTSATASSSPEKTVIGSEAALAQGRSLLQQLREPGLSPDERSRLLVECVAALAPIWPQLRPDEVVAAANTCVESVYQLPAQSATTALDTLFAIGSPDDSASQTRSPNTDAFLTGLAARIARDADLPPAITSRAVAAVRQRAGAVTLNDRTFTSGVHAAIDAARDRLADATAQSSAATTLDASWSDLAMCIRASTDDPAVRERLLATTLDGVLRAKAEPTQSVAVLSGVGQLTRALDWSPTGEARRWLLRWFDDPSITSRDLFAITTALGTVSSSSGIDATMVLSAGAADSARSELRDRYATLWSLSTTRQRLEGVDRLVNDLNSELKRERPGSHPLFALESALRFSRLNSVAANLWDGYAIDQVAALDSVLPQPPQNIQRDLLANVPATIKIVGKDPSSTSEWALKYLEARQRIPERRDLLANVPGTPDDLESAILVEEATRGSPPQVRADARAHVLNGSTNPAIIGALLNFASVIPPTLENADLVRTLTGGSIPQPRDPTFRPAIRLALTERLSQLLASSINDGYADTCSDEIARWYGLARFDSTPIEADLSRSVAPEILAARTAAAWLKIARIQAPSGREHATLSEIVRNAEARRRMAASRIQRFVAEQAASVELFAFVAVAENPAHAERVKTILADCESQRLASKHVFDQASANERAIARLWLARNKEEEK